MKGINYSYGVQNGKQILFLNSTEKLNNIVLAIDYEFLEGKLIDQKQLNNGWSGKCPFCKKSSELKKYSYEFYRPCYLNRKENGYVFSCCSCKQSLTTFKFLNALDANVAQDYATRRWKAGQLCGAEWNCPLPNKVKKDLLEAKESDRSKYKSAYQAQRELNYKNKYGSI